MERYVLCIDNGLTATKAVIFTLQGKELSSGVVNTVVESRNEFNEIDMELQWKNTAAAIRQTIAASGIDPANIAGIGNSGHGAGLYCLDNRGRPVRKAITSMDARASGILEQWEKEGRSSYDRLYQNLWSGQPVPILYWLKKHEPENYNGIARILMVKDWIIYNLTGETGIEYTDASNSGFINPLSRNIDYHILKMFNVEEISGCIPKLRATTDVAGYVTKAAAEETGLKAGTPVMCGVYDVVACALGSGVYDEEKYSLIAGTWNINSGIEKRLIKSGSTVKCSLFADINKYIFVESSATSAVNLDWFINKVVKGFGLSNMANSAIFKRTDAEVEKIKPDASGVMYMPFLYKSHLASNMNGSFLGIRPEHDVFHMLRAVFEGVVFAHLKHIENLRKGGIDRKAAVLSGGASNSDLWSQMFADILNMEIRTTQASQAGALGMAVCAAVAVKEYSGFSEAVNTMVHIKKSYYPDKNNYQIYMAKYKEFKKIINMFEQYHPQI